MEYFNATRSIHPQRLERPVVAPNSFPTRPKVSPSSLKSSGNFVRIRINEVNVSNGLKILNKAESENYSRQDYQEPIQIISRTFNCNEESIFIEFEENINIDYLEFVQNQNNEYKAFRTLNIKALS